MKLSAVEQVEQTKGLVLAELQEHQMPISLANLGLSLGVEAKLSHRTLKEAVWLLVEEGKAKFNSTWDLEIL